MKTTKKKERIARIELGPAPGQAIWIKTFDRTGFRLPDQRFPVSIGRPDLVGAVLDIARIARVSASLLPRPTGTTIEDFFEYALSAIATRADYFAAAHVSGLRFEIEPAVDHWEPARVSLATAEEPDSPFWFGLIPRTAKTSVENANRLVDWLALLFPVKIRESGGEWREVRKL